MIDPISKDKSKIYKSIELIVRVKENGKFNGEIKIEHKNSAMLISGNFLILMSVENQYQKGDIYNLNEIKSYRTNLTKPE